MAGEVTLEKVVALCKRRGFVYPSAEVYGGLNGVYDFGPLGVVLRQRIKDAWLRDVMGHSEDVVQLDGALLGHSEVWRASGHVDNFSDPLVDCMNCKKRFRADELDLSKPCPSCGIKQWTDVRKFMLMFQTQLGAVADQASVAYLRPETAQSVFVNFKNVTSSTRVKMPFGIAQIGKAFRNEITPKQFLFRVREFEQMELEFFCRPTESDGYFETWLKRREAFYDRLGLKKENLRFRTHEKDELAHYSKYCTDVEYQFPFGWKELEGIAHRGDYDLTQHSKCSGKDLSYFDAETNEKYMPHVVECSVGVDRLFLTLLFDAYREEKVADEERVVLKLAAHLAPIQAAVFPLVKKLSEPALKLFEELKRAGIAVQFDDAGSIGKRYRRFDEIGTPICITYDFDSETDHMVTVRNRDTLAQERISLGAVIEYAKKVLQ